MTNLSQPTSSHHAIALTASATANPISLAAEWITLCSGCEHLMSYEEWCERKTAAAEYIDTWGEAERTEFFYAVAEQAGTEPMLAPTPGLVMTPENIARELHRLEDVVRMLDDGQSEHAPYDWIRFTDPVIGGFTDDETWRYATERSNLARTSATSARLGASEPISNSAI